MAHYYGRFREAFVTEANEFTACCLDNTEPLVRLEGRDQCCWCALQESLTTGKRIGRRITPTDEPLKTKL